MGLVREYDVVRGLLALIPGVREQSPYPYTQTHTHVTARLQAPQLSISTQIRQTLHPRTKYVTHRARARAHTFGYARTRTPVDSQKHIQIEKRADIIVSVHTQIHTNAHAYAHIAVHLQSWLAA